MIWVCRAGQDAIYKDYYLKTNRIYLAWSGFNFDLSTLSTRSQCKELVQKEKEPANPTSIATWGGQLYVFSSEMHVDDYVLIPSKGSKSYTFAKIIGPYTYNSHNKMGLWHSHEIEVLCDEIPRGSFSKPIQYSLGAYRTVFKVKQEQEVMNVIFKR